MEKFKIENVGKLESISRLMVKEKIDSTGCEVSINNIPKGTGSQFIHSHKLNEEVIIITKGRGTIYVDGDEISISEGSLIKLAPSVKRGFSASEDSDLQLICIQAAENSLTQATREDGIINREKASWFK